MKKVSAFWTTKIISLVLLINQLTIHTKQLTSIVATQQWIIQLVNKQCHILSLLIIKFYINIPEQREEYRE